MAKSAPKDGPSIAALKERMDRDPFSRAFLQLTEEYRKQGRFDEAVQVCLEGLSRHPAYHTARIALGRTYLEAGDLENAQRALSEVFEMMPENHLAGKLLAQVQTLLGDRTAAAATCREILRHYAGDREIESMLGQLEAPSGSVAGSPTVAPAPAPRQLTDPGFEYRPEDLAGAVPLPAGAPSPPGTPPGATVEAHPQPAGVGGVAPRAAEPVETGGPARAPQHDVFQTNTLAELYLRQGLVEKAIEVYRGMLRVDPWNDPVRRRLEELAPGSCPEPRGPRPASAGGLRHTPNPDPPSPTGASNAVPAAPRPGAVIRLERWLAAIRAASPDAPGKHPR